MDFSRFDEKFIELHRAMQKQIKESVDPEAAIDDMNNKINVIMDALGLEIPETEKQETKDVEMKNIKTDEESDIGEGEESIPPVEEVKTEETETTTTNNSGSETKEETSSSDTFTVPESIEDSNTYYTITFKDSFKFTDYYKKLEEKGLTDFKTSSFAELIEYLKYLPINYEEQQQIINKDSMIENGNLLYDMMFTVDKVKNEPVQDVEMKSEQEEVTTN